LRRRLSQVEPGVDHYSLGRYAGGHRPGRPFGQESADVAHQVGVHRLGVGDPGSEPDVGGDHAGAGGGSRTQVSRVGEPADVVAEDGAGPERLRRTPARHVSTETGRSKRATSPSTAGRTRSISSASDTSGPGPP